MAQRGQGREGSIFTVFLWMSFMDEPKDGNVNGIEYL